MVFLIVAFALVLFVAGVFLYGKRTGRTTEQNKNLKTVNEQAKIRNDIENRNRADDSNIRDRVRKQRDQLKRRL